MRNYMYMYGYVYMCRLRSLLARFADDSLALHSLVARFAGDSLAPKADQGCQRIGIQGLQGFRDRSIQGIIQGYADATIPDVCTRSQS